MNKEIDITKGMKDGEKIVLPEVKLNKYNPSFAHLSFIMNSITEEDAYNLARLKEILNKVGVNMEMTHHVIFSDHTEYNSVRIFFTEENVLEKASRNAGRKKDYGMSSRYKKCSVSELKVKLESGMKKSEIIKELGCPKATFYRILKNIEELEVFEDWDEEKEEKNKGLSIWSYTS